MDGTDLHHAAPEGAVTDASSPGARPIAHIPVMLRETVEMLNPRPGGIYVDGTLGAGGHAAEILTKSGPDGILVGLDQDADAIARCTDKLHGFGSRALLRRGNFREIQRVLAELGFASVDGVLLDIGVSSFHLRSPERGFSFQLDGPLDMRMDGSSGTTAADLVNTLPRLELAALIREYGEERKAGAIAAAIDKARSRQPILTTGELASIVSRVFPPYPPRRIHPATLTFQALRIAVNDELAALRDGLADAIPLLRPGGRIAVITFHSLEDRIVKQTFASLAKACVCPPRMPVCCCGTKPMLRIVTGRPVIPGPEEISRNPASRSAKLRVAERI